MTIEEKVRAYDEALKAAIAAHKDEDRHLKATLERIFPELKESEDERIRNQIINFIEEYGNPIHCEWQKDWIAWLDKQKHLYETTKDRFYLEGFEEGQLYERQKEQKPAENSAKVSESSTEEKDMDEYKKGFECGKQRVLKYPEDFGLCKNPVWSEEDEKIRKWIKKELENKYVEDGIVNNVLADKAFAWLEKQGEHVEINPTEFDTRLQALIGKFETLPKEELASSLSFYLNVVQNDGTYKSDEKQDEQKPTDKIQLGKRYKCIASPRYSAFMKGEIYKPEDKFLCSLMNFCSDCFEPIEDGEQKPTDKVEPKFHEGEWVVYKCGEETVTLQITRIVGETYVFSDDSTLGVVDEDTLRLWDITKDAKDGDVLAFSYASQNYILIYKGLYEKNLKTKMSVFCFYSVEEDTYYDETDSFHVMNTGEVIKPATKEQRDTLMKAMTDAGYTFNFEKKELKKIEQKSTWSEEDERMYKSIIYSFNHNYPLTIQQQEFVKSLRPQPKQEWSEEDKDYYDAIITKLEVTKDDALLTNNQMEFLKSLNGKIQSRQEWSEEDERMLHNLLECLRRGWRKLPADILKYESWLKSLRPQNHWKPTDAQLRCLSYAISSINTYEAKHFELQKLYNELKQLK